MAELILFHHAQGLTPGVVNFANQLGSSGHTVHTPDLFAGQTFSSLQDGVAHASEIGFGEIIERGVQFAERLHGDLVYAGMSLGVLPAQLLAQTRNGARGALLLYSAIPLSEFSDTWPIGVPVQIHAKENDEFYLEDAAAAAELVDVAGADLYLYPGDQHLFTDSSVDAYDEAATNLVVERILEFLERIG